MMDNWLIGAIWCSMPGSFNYLLLLFHCFNISDIDKRFENWIEMKKPFIAFINIYSI